MSHGSLETVSKKGFKNRGEQTAHLDELVQGGVGGIVGDEEPHVFVGDLHGGRSVHTSHRDNAKPETTTTTKSLPQM